MFKYADDVLESYERYDLDDGQRHARLISNTSVVEEYQMVKAVYRSMAN